MKPHGHGKTPKPSCRALVVYGTRPEAIKLFPVIETLRDRPDFRVHACAVRQHTDLLDQVEQHLGLRADAELRVPRGSGHLNTLAGETLMAMQQQIEAFRPDWVIVQGDTTSALAGALAGFQARIRVAHVEAGLRTGDLQKPFPEEANRRIIDSLSALHFAPTLRARRVLLDEGFASSGIHLTGNTVVDALRRICPKEGVRVRDEVLVTVHRRESLGAPLQGILEGIRILARRHPGTTWVIPAHPNPRVRDPIGHELGNLPNVRVLPPLNYPCLLEHLGRCRLVLTDSGGIQEEAPVLGKPVLVLRDATERPEGIEAGVAALVGTCPRRIVEATTRLLTDSSAYDAMARSVSPYGDGRAAERIAAVLAGDPYPPLGATDTA